jgi:hypothetical protein
MSHNLNLLRQNYSRPASVGGRAIPIPFPLGRECHQAKMLLAKAPKKVLHLEEFDPAGLEQTYIDEATGAEFLSSKVTTGCPSKLLPTRFRRATMLTPF